ncbi:MAG: DUF6174 domain-containing protein [Flavobacteriaceae bacterium]|jgi:hypothetical protein|nr:DUF6174 domain-containing protein [Flavobacteriaceae bacterium]MDG1912849.1 DUF6174 domain-containing protein [Flavobacteriaceae bacterium]
MKLYFAPFFILFIFLNCTKNTEVIPEDEVSQQEQKWKKQGITEYAFTLQISCFCIVDYTRPKSIVVKNNQIESVNGIAYTDLEYETYMTFDDFFEYIKERQKENPVQENLEFDPTYGFPTYIYFDISEMIADEEIGYTITDFLPRK